MIDTIGLSDEIFHQRSIEYGIDYQPKPGVIFEMGDVGVAACRKIVDDRHLVVISQQLIG